MASNEQNDQEDALLCAYFEKMEWPATWSGVPTKPFYSPAETSGLDYRRDLNVDRHPRRFPGRDAGRRV